MSLLQRLHKAFINKKINRNNRKPEPTRINDKTLIVAADTPVLLRRSLLLDLPGELRNRIYDLAFGDKSLHPYPQRHVITGRSPEYQEEDIAQSTEYHGLYNLRLTCRQIAKETEPYLFHTLDISLNESTDLVVHAFGDTKEHLDLFKTNMEGRWQHVRHLITSNDFIHHLVFSCEAYKPYFHLPNVEIFYYVAIVRGHGGNWAEDGRNLTTITFHDMHKAKAVQRKQLLHIMGFYFPKLVDVRCSYHGDEGCMRRYRITRNGELKWWYTGGLFKKLPDEPTKEQWFSKDHGRWPDGFENWHGSVGAAVSE